MLRESGRVQVFRVLFTSEGKLEEEINRQIGAALAVMLTLKLSVLMKKELRQKANLSIYR